MREGGLTHTWASRTRKRGEAGRGRPDDGGVVASVSPPPFFFSLWSWQPQRLETGSCIDIPITRAMTAVPTKLLFPSSAAYLLCLRKFSAPTSPPPPPPRTPPRRL